MRTQVLIIIGIMITGAIAAVTFGTIEYQSAYNQNCNLDGGYVVGFLRCTYVREDFAGPKIEGMMADEICSIIGGECPPYYIGNSQEDGSLVVIVTMSDIEKERQITFFIKNDTLSYEERK